jgi:hypothetical protein
MNFIQDISKIEQATFIDVEDDGFKFDDDNEAIEALRLADIRNQAEKNEEGKKGATGKASGKIDMDKKMLANGINREGRGQLKVTSTPNLRPNSNKRKVDKDKTRSGSKTRKVNKEVEGITAPPNRGEGEGNMQPPKTGGKED